MTPLRCICAADTSCPYCHATEYLKLRSPLGGSFFITSARQKPVTSRALAATFRKMGALLGMEEIVVTPHACRVTGARHWARLGVHETTILIFGDWKSISILRKYLGTASLSSAMAREITSAKNPNSVPLVEVAQIRLPPDLLKPQHRDNDTLAVVTKRRPRRWHKVVIAGPSSGWQTFCGDFVNFHTMHLQMWSEQPADEPTCMKCM